MTSSRRNPVPPSVRVPPAAVERRRRLGRDGEAAAADWYEDNGFEVLARNWRCRDGELDLILAGSGTIVFCEVKTRSSNAFGTPAAAVTSDKQRRIRHLAMRWLDTAGRHPMRIRFDVVAVTNGHVEVIEHAF